MLTLLFFVSKETTFSKETLFCARAASVAKRDLFRLVFENNNKEK